MTGLNLKHKAISKVAKRSLGYSEFIVPEIVHLEHNVETQVRMVPFWRVATRMEPTTRESRHWVKEVVNERVKY